jgi:site-specific DNA recombinase
LIGMKKAVLYARVSSDMQRQERTIESQIVELKKQIAGDGHVLVKEYVDDGYSGAQLDRPALDQLRNDLKADLFDAIYFLNTDRIARDVTYQNIIIAEILKHQKQIIINGKDYVHNPENKFTLTVLGAVAELERAKIIERATRGKQQRLAQGFLLGCGNNIYGYDYIRRTPHSPPQYAINQHEAAVVQYVFSEYAKGQVGTNPITRVLEDRGVPTKTGKKLWRKSLIKCMLRNETYTGIRYFNTMRLIRDQANPFHVTSRSRKWLVPRDRAEWIGIKIPVIIPQSLFDKVQKRLEWNRTRYRNPRQVQLLSSMVRCGSCGGGFYAYRNWYKDKRAPEPRIFHKVAYKCNWRLQQQMHSKNSAVERCHNKEIKAEALEGRVFAMIRDVMLDPTKLRECMDFFKDESQVMGRRLERRLKVIELQLRTLDDEKRRILDIYASGDLSREAYVAKSLRYDTEMTELTDEQNDLVQRMPLLHNTEAVEVAMTEYCGKAKARLERCDDFATKRQFLLDHIEKVVFWNDNVTVHGSVPILQKCGGGAAEPEDAAQIGFCIESRISMDEKLAGRRRECENEARNGAVCVRRKSFVKVSL